MSPSMRTPPRRDLRTSQSRDTDSIASNPVLSLSTKDFRWLHEEAWESAHLEYFAGLRAGWRGYLARLAANKQGVTHQAGRWVLVDEAGHPLCWAEAAFYPGNYPRYVLVFGDLPNGEASFAAAYLISALFLANEIDIIRVLGTPLAKLWPEAAADGHIRPALVPGANLLAPRGQDADSAGLLSQDALMLDSQSWWDNKLATEARSQLRYLISRRDRKESQAHAAARSRPRSVPLIAKLFGFGRRI